MMFQYKKTYLCFQVQIARVRIYVYHGKTYPFLSGMHQHDKKCLSLSLNGYRVSFCVNNTK